MRSKRCWPSFEPSRGCSFNSLASFGMQWRSCTPLKEKDSLNLHTEAMWTQSAVMFVAADIFSLTISEANQKEEGFNHSYCFLITGGLWDSLCHWVKEADSSSITLIIQVISADGLELIIYVFSLRWNKISA